MDIVAFQYFFYVMIQVMQKHQKYFGIADNSGRLLPYFIAVRLILVYTPVFFGAEFVRRIDLSNNLLLPWVDFRWQMEILMWVL